MSKAILLIHGFATDIDDFYNIIPDLTKRYDYIELKNLPGHGKNSNLKQFDVEKTFACVEESAQKLLARFDEVDVIGFSMGGSLAAYLASKYHFNKIVLLAPANNYINWKLGLLCAIGGIAGGIIGAHLLKKIPDYIIKIAFTCFLVYVSITMIW